jgi:crotonobetaine/carnitine-CoA ligase
VSAAIYDGEWVLSSVIDDRAETLGDAAAVTGERDLSYAELREEASRLAGGLGALGVAPGDRVATFLPSNVDYVSTFCASAWAGAVEVPVNTAFKGTFLEHVVAESGASVIVVADEYVERLAAVHTPDLRHVVVVGDDGGEPVPGTTMHRFADLLSSDPAPRVPSDETDMLMILYTSGTTGPSKGVIHCNRSAMWTPRFWLDIAELGPDDVGYSFLPLFHVAARSALVLPLFVSGGSAVIRERFSAGDFWRDVRATGSTFTMYMGAAVHFLYSQPERADDADNPLTRLGGAAAPREIAADFERRFDCRLLEVYGMTELGTTTGLRAADVVPGTMGRAFRHVELAIVDDLDNPVPAGEPGEIVARPTEPWAIFGGYWSRPEATVEAWRNLWFHTGDLGTMTETGELVFVDRKKDAIRRRGENISSFELEEALHRHPAIAEAAAYAVPSEFTEDEVMVALVIRDCVQIDWPELVTFCEENLPHFAVPRYFRTMDEFPKTPTGRVEKYKLRADGTAMAAHEREIVRGRR